MDIKDLIIQRIGCSAEDADVVSMDLKVIHPDLQPMLDAWIANESFDADRKFNGYSLNDLMFQNGLAFTGAILTLDWLLKDPEKALAAIHYGIC